MKTVSRILFCSLAFLLFFGSILHYAGNRIAPDTITIPAELSLEHRDFSKAPECSLDAFMAGSFQDRCESYIADLFPERQPALIANAKLQRMGIMSSNCLFGYDCYPTFYGSKYSVMTSEYGTVVGMANDEVVDDEFVDAWVNTVNDVAAKNPDINFIHYNLLRPNQVSFYPVRKYTNKECIDEAWCREKIADRLDSSVTAMIDMPYDEEDLFCGFFPSDDHWTFNRMVDGYNLIASEAGLEQRAFDDVVCVSEGWHGGSGRSSLYLETPGVLYDTTEPFSHLKTWKIIDDGELVEKTFGLRDDVLAGTYDMNDNEFEGYTDYFGVGQKYIVNEGDNNGRTCLIVGDSYTHGLWRFIADNYQETYVILPGNAKNERTFLEVVEEYDPDDVIVIMHPAKLNSIAAKSPNFLGISKESAKNAVSEDQG